MMPFILLVLAAGCSPMPASIAFDGGGTEVIVHSRNSVPVRHAVALDQDGKALDPQPRVFWTVDRTDVVALKDGTLTPVQDGAANVTATIGDLSASYVLTVELSDDEPTDAGSTFTRNGCPTTDFGDGVYVFGCDKESFPYALAEFLKNHDVGVSAVSPLIESSVNSSWANSYLVVTRPR